jgi:hypothetical protein
MNFSELLWTFGGKMSGKESEKQIKRFGQAEEIQNRCKCHSIKKVQKYPR